MAEVLPADAIAIIAGELSNGMMAQETNEILRCLAGKGNELSQADVQRETGLSYTICREALLLLLGATFISRNRKGYQLSMTGRLLIEMIKQNQKNRG
jgi:DNA-binding GntR family transcriptional regulator